MAGEKLTYTPVALHRPSLVDNPLSMTDVQALYAQLPGGNSFGNPLERSGGFNMELLNTCHHELQHGLAAWRLGVPIELLSVKREGDSLGRTKFAGFVPYETLKMISVAGVMDTPVGASSGFGSDLATFQIAHQLGGRKGLSASGALLSVSSLIGSAFPEPVRKRAAVILASKKEITGDMLPVLMNRAAAELALERKVNFDIAKFKEFFDVEQIKSEKEQTIMNYLADGRIQWQYLVDGKIVDTKTFCPGCGLEQGHAKGCKFTPKESGDKKLTLVMHPQEGAQYISPEYYDLKSGQVKPNPDIPSVRFGSTGINRQGGTIWDRLSEMII